MRLTRKKSIELCIVLWTWLAKTGKLKEEWPGWKKHRYALNGCWLCEYSYQRQRANKSSRLQSFCIFCPYYKAICKECFGSYYGNWADAKTPQTRKRYAKLFLEQIKTLA